MLPNSFSLSLPNLCCPASHSCQGLWHCSVDSVHHWPACPCPLAQANNLTHIQKAALDACKTADHAIVHEQVATRHEGMACTKAGGGKSSLAQASSRALTTAQAQTHNPPRPCPLTTLTPTLPQSSPHGPVPVVFLNPCTNPHNPHTAATPQSRPASDTHSFAH